MSPSRQLRSGSPTWVDHHRNRFQPLKGRRHWSGTLEERRAGIKRQFRLPVSTWRHPADLTGCSSPCGTLAKPRAETAPHPCRRNANDQARGARHHVGRNAAWHHAHGSGPDVRPHRRPDASGCANQPGLDSRGVHRGRARSSWHRARTAGPTCRCGIAQPDVSTGISAATRPFTSSRVRSR